MESRKRALVDVEQQPVAKRLRVAGNDEGTEATIIADQTAPEGNEAHVCNAARGSFDGNFDPFVNLGPPPLLPSQLSDMSVEDEMKDRSQSQSTMSTNTEEFPALDSRPSFPSGRTPRVLLGLTGSVATIKVYELVDRLLKFCEVLLSEL